LSFSVRTLDTDTFTHYTQSVAALLLTGKALSLIIREQQCKDGVEESDLDEPVWNTS